MAAVVCSLLYPLLGPSAAWATEAVYVSTSSMVFGGESNGIDASPQGISVAAGGREVSWDRDRLWVSVERDSNGFLQVRADTSSLPAGTHIGHITFGAIGYASTTVTVTAVISPSGQAVPNGGFEAVSGPWTVSTGVWKASGDYPRTGAGNLAFTQGGQSAYVDVRVPATARSLKVSFNVRTSTTSYLCQSCGQHDRLILSAPAGNSTSGAEITELDSTGQTPAAASYRTYELNTPPGSFRLEFHTDFRHSGTQFRVDDVSVKWKPEIYTSPGSLSFDYVVGGVAPATQKLSVHNSGGGEIKPAGCSYPEPDCDDKIPWTASDDQPWMSLSALSGPDVGYSTWVSVNGAGLAPGTYSGKITVTIPGVVMNSPVTVPVTVTVRRPTIAVSSPYSATWLEFVAPLGGTTGTQPLSVGNPEGGTFSWTASDGASWLSVSPASGTLPATASSAPLTVSVSTAGLTAGTYTATITVTATASAGVTGSPRTVPVTLIVRGPTLDAGPNVRLYASEGGPNPAPGDLSIGNAGGGSFSWTLSESTPWLSLSPTSGTLGTYGRTRVSASVSTAGLAVGTYTGTITVTAAGAASSPRTVTVTVVVSPAGSIANGGFETQPGDPWDLCCWDSSIGTRYPHGGNNYLALGAPDSDTWENDGFAWAWQQIAIPGTVTSADLRFWLNVSSEETTTTTKYDTLTVEVRDAVSDALLGTVATFSNLDKASPGAYAERGPFSLAFYRGKQIKIVFSEKSDAQRKTTFRIDDVSVTTGNTTIPKLAVSPSSLSFTATAGGANPAAKTLSVSNAAGGTLSWTASDNQTWLSVSPASGSVAAISTGSTAVSVSTAGLAAGTYSGTITFTASGATGSPVTVPVTLTVAGAVTNGGFEGSVSPWVLSGNAYWTGSGASPHWGNGYIYLGDRDMAAGAAYQTVTIPAATGTLKLWLAVEGDEYRVTDKLFVEVRDTAGTLLATAATYTDDDWTGGYYDPQTVDLSAFRGRTVRLQFRTTTDTTRPTTFRIDDVSIS